MSKLWALLFAFLEWGLGRLHRRNTSDAKDAEVPPGDIPGRIRDKLLDQTRKP